MAEPDQPPQERTASPPAAEEASSLALPAALRLLRNRLDQVHREQVRERAVPGNGLPMSLNGAHTRHLLEKNLPEHRDPARFAAHLNDKPVDEEEVRADFAVVLQRAWVRSQQSFLDFEPYRVRVAYRWVREAATLKGLIEADQLLSEALLDVDPDPWSNGDVGRAPLGSGYVRLRSDVVRRLLPPKGISLLPPAVPDKFRDEDGLLLEDYNPRDDRGLMKWLDTFRRVSLYLGIINGTATNPDEGRWGLYGMDDPDTVRLVFPSIAQILTWEELLVCETWHKLVDLGQVGAQRWSRETYGYTDNETAALMRRARNWGVMSNQIDLDSERVLKVAQLDQIAERAQSGIDKDLRAELAARKAQAIILGLSRSEGDEFGEEAKEIIMRQARAALGPPKTKGLPG